MFSQNSYTDLFGSPKGEKGYSMIETSGLILIFAIVVTLSFIFGSNYFLTKKTNWSINITSKIIHFGTTFLALITVGMALDSLYSLDYWVIGIVFGLFSYPFIKHQLLMNRKKK